MYERLMGVRYGLVMSFCILCRGLSDRRSFSHIRRSLRPHVAPLRKCIGRANWRHRVFAARLHAIGRVHAASHNLGLALAHPLLWWSSTCFGTMRTFACQP